MNCPTCGLPYTGTPWFCPECHSIIPGGSINVASGKDYDHIPDGERQMVLDNKKWQEELILSGSRDDGSFKSTEVGPNWTRPFNNDPLERKQAIEAHKATLKNAQPDES